MKLVFAGLEHPVELAAGEVAVLQVENSALFARFANSLQSELGSQASEPYSLWDGEEEIKPGDALMVVPDALNLPWGNRAFFGSCCQESGTRVLGRRGFANSN